MFRRIGLTGGIGSGKTTVSQRLAELGATIVDSDVIAREVVAPGTAGYVRVVERFGTAVLDRTGALDRAKLAGVVFNDFEALGDLNEIVHPLVRERAIDLEAGARVRAEVVVHDIPLLVENGSEVDFDELVVVEAPVEVRIERLAARGLGRVEAEARMAAQASDDERREVATVVLDNGGSRGALLVQVDALWPRLTSGAGA